MILFKDLFRRLLQVRRWVAGQYLLTALLIVVGIAWTRLPEKHFWQVALSLLLPLLIGLAAIELQAGTIRSFSTDDGKRIKLIWGALSLLVWLAVVVVAWGLLDWLDGKIPELAGYLNSKATAHERAKILTYENIYLWITYIEWTLRWIVVPAKVLPFAVASAQWSFHLPWRKVFRLLLNWRWWSGVVIAALLGVLLPSALFSSEPHGSVSAQIWRVTLKLVVAYLLVIGSWVLLLGWCAVLLDRRKEPPAEKEFAEIPALVGPPEPDKKLSVKLPLPETD